MALADLKAGRRVATPDKYLRNASTRDYSHLLAPEHRAAGYGLTVSVGDSHQPGVRLQHGHLTQQVGRRRVGVGDFHGSLEGDEALAGTAHVEEGHRNKGLGPAMYEAWLAHARNHGGAKRVSTTEISTASDGVFRRLAAKHGLAYSSELASPDAEVGPFDSRFALVSFDL